MATSADLNWEENLVAHWMSDTSRAGVILNPMFPNLKITRANSFENASLSIAVNSLHSSRSTSLSEDSLHKGQAFRSSSSCEETLDTSTMLLPNSLAKKDPVLVVQDAPDSPTALQTDPVCDKLEDLDEKHCTDILLQKLEQLKGLQQHKQEQLRKQQMDQIQRLMEEQQKLLFRVPEQQTHTGFAVTEDGINQRYIQSPRLSPVPCLPSHCQDDSNHLDSISSPVEQRDSLKKFKSGQVMKGSLSEKECLDVPFKVQGELEIEVQNAVTGGSNWSPDQSLLVCGDGDINCEDKMYVESFKNLTGRKCLDSLNAEERPILATIQERKQTFEEFLEEQIQLEEQRLSQKEYLKDTVQSSFQKPVAKRPFLKRGEGLVRFNNARSKAAKQKENRVTLQPDISEINNLVKVNKPQFHRKTAPSNKDQVSDNFLSKNGNQSAKTKKSFTTRKTVFKNCTVKGIPLSTRDIPNERKAGEMRKSVRSQINENNKENITALAALNEMDMLPGEKPEKPMEPTRCLTNSFGKDPDLSFELSFQGKLENWETEKEREKNELDEFLFLEQAADEISFASNSSVIVRILDQGQQISTGHRLSSTPVKSRHSQKHVLDITSENSKNGEQYVFQKDNTERTRSTVVGCQTHETLKNHQNKTGSKVLQAFPTKELQDYGNISWNDEDRSHSSDKTSESEEEFETTITSVSERAKKLSMNNKMDMPEFSEGEGKADVPREPSPDLHGIDSCSDQANEINRVLVSENICCASSNNIKFDDETSWSDFEENENLCNEAENSDLVIKVPLSSSGSAKNESVFPDKVIKRKVVIVKKGDVVPKQNVTDNEVTPPPATDLMLKLFPSLKPKQKVDVQQKCDAKSNIAQEESGGDSARSQLLREKLVELEMEIERFRVENASLTKLREESENAMEKLRKEIADFEQQKKKELAQIEEFKKEETRKLQKERKVFEKYAQAARAIPDKKERDEIQALKQQMATLQGDLKRRESKWSTTHMRLRDQIEALTKENMQLREEIRIMERCRLEAWKRKEASANKKKTDGCNYTKRMESTHPSVVLQKSQTFSSVHQAERKSKTNDKSDSSSEGRPFAKTKPVAACNGSSLDNTTKSFEDSSRTFMVVSKNSPASGMVDSASVVTSDLSDSEDGIVEKEATHPDGKVEKIFKNGCHLIIFPNGTRKEVSGDGKVTTVSFFNGDIKQILEDHRVVYYYADAKTTHTTYPTGLEVLHFSNGQIEKHFPDGRKEIVFPDQTIKNVFMDGQEENIFPDGTIVRIQQDGSRMIEFSNGQQEVHTAHFKRREYPDGTIKTVYADGHQETQYASGRVRVKDKDGNVIMDTLP